MKRKGLLLGFGVAIVATASAFTTARNYTSTQRFYWSGGAPGSGQCTPITLDVNCATSTTPNCVEGTGHGPQQLYNTGCANPLARQ